VTWWLSHFGTDNLDGIEVRVLLHQSVAAEGLAQFMHIGTMEVLDYLQFKGCAVAKVHNVRGMDGFSASLDAR